MGAGASTLSAEDASTWSKEEVAAQICALGEAYEQYKDIALKNGIDGQQLLDLDDEDNMADLVEAEKEMVDSSAEKLYGLIHARYITTSHGLNQMHKKYLRADFGRCHRVFCADDADQVISIPCMCPPIHKSTSIRFLVQARSLESFRIMIQTCACQITPK